MGSALPDISCHKGRQRVTDDEDRHNGPPLCEQRPCTCTPHAHKLPPVHLRYLCVQSNGGRHQVATAKTDRRFRNVRKDRWGEGIASECSQGDG